MKYILVSGGVVSGLGKGVTASSVGVLLKNCGFRVTSIKIGTFQIGSCHAISQDHFSLLRGVLLAQIHTSTQMREQCLPLSMARSSCLTMVERWALQLSGFCHRCIRCNSALSLSYCPILQVDLDLGNYERFLDITLTRDNNLTTGKIYQVSPAAFSHHRADSACN